MQALLQVLILNNATKSKKTSTGIFCCLWVIKCKMSSEVPLTGHPIKATHNNRLRKILENLDKFTARASTHR